MTRNWALLSILLFLTSVANTQTVLKDGDRSVLKDRDQGKVQIVAKTDHSGLEVSRAGVSANSEALPIAPSRLVTPPSERTADTKFWLVNGYDALWTVVDIETTAANLSRNPTCREMNPLVGARPSRKVLYLSNLPVMVGAGYLSYRSRKHHGKHWYLLPALSGSAHAAGSIWNMTGSSC